MSFIAATRSVIASGAAVAIGRNFRPSAAISTLGSARAFSSPSPVHEFNMSASLPLPGRGVRAFSQATEKPQPFLDTAMVTERVLEVVKKFEKVCRLLVLAADFFCWGSLDFAIPKFYTNYIKICIFSLLCVPFSTINEF